MWGQAGPDGEASSAGSLASFAALVALVLAAVVLVGMWREAFRYRDESMEGLALVWSAAVTGIVAASALPLIFVTWSAGRASSRCICALALVCTATVGAWAVHAAIHG